MAVSCFPCFFSCPHSAHCSWHSGPRTRTDPCMHVCFSLFLTVRVSTMSIALLRRSLSFTTTGKAYLSLEVGHRAEAPASSFSYYSCWASLTCPRESRPSAACHCQPWREELRSIQQWGNILERVNDAKIRVLFHKPA